MTQKGKQTLQRVFWTLVLAAMFFAGLITGTDRAFRRGFEKGHEAASNHISTRIREGMKGLEPFYVSDIGFRFSPRGFTITNIRFIGDEAVYSAKAEASK